MERTATNFPFFPRNGLTDQDRLSCDRIASHFYPDDDCTPHKHQGYCSYTILATPKTSKTTTTLISKKPHIVQFRPSHYALNPLITTAATQIHGHSAPKTKHLGPITLNPNASSAEQDEAFPPTLHVHDISLIPGIPYSTALITRSTLTPPELHRQQNLITSFAAFLARTWPGETAPSPHIPQGKVSPNITAKLQTLTTALPTPALRLRAAEVLQRSKKMLGRLPVVLTHGDVVPSNIMTDAGGAGRVEGMVDWAEAEGLPFGMCFYGLEFLLGWVGEKGEEEEGHGSATSSAGSDSPSSSSRASASLSSSSQHDVGTKTELAHSFTYYATASSLRQLFWTELARLVPDLLGPDVMEAVQCARDVGVLLWFGYAWDEGSIDRVVDAERDGKEVLLLRRFLGVEERGRGDCGGEKGKEVIEVEGMRGEENAVGESEGEQA